MHGPTCIFWANLTHFSLEAAPVDAARGSYLQHSCWTYWGHSGAPLFDEQGCLVGLHNSWDEDDDGQRHGVDWERIVTFVGATCSC